MSEIDFNQYPDFVLHQFACDVAERALITVWEATNEEPDERSVNAIAVKRRWIEGEASDEELANSRDAAWYAARSAAWYAAWNAARYARDAARSAAWAARDAASYAAWAAAWAVAWAASDAARSAYYAARAAASNAANDAANDAAWDAAWDAEKQWQASHIEKLHKEYKQSRRSILRTLLRRKELLTPAAYDWASETESILFLGV